MVRDCLCQSIVRGGYAPRAHIVGPLFEMSSKFPYSDREKQTILVKLVVSTRLHAGTPKAVLVHIPRRTGERMRAAKLGPYEIETLGPCVLKQLGEMNSQIIL